MSRDRLAGVLLLALLPLPGPAGSAPLVETETLQTEGSTPQPSAEPLKGESRGPSFQDFFRDGKYLLTFPARPTRRGVFITASVLAATGFLIAQDADIREWVEGNRGETTGDLEGIFEPIGKFESGLAIAGGAYLMGRLAHAPKLRKTGAVAFESFLWTAAITAGTKGLFGRESPRDPANSGRFWEGGDHFPSGHTSRTFAIAAVFAESYGPKAAWVGYPIATLVGLARIESSDHWASDVLAGAALGTTIGKAIARRHLDRPGPPRLTAMVDGSGGIRLELSLGPRPGN